MKSRLRKLTAVIAGKKWLAVIMFQKKRIELGVFDVFEDAVAARKPPKKNTSNQSGTNTRKKEPKEIK